MGIFFKSNPRYDISYRDELSNGALIFTIDKPHDFSLVGDVVVSPDGKVTIVERSSCNLEENDRNYIENQAKKFYDASR